MNAAITYKPYKKGNDDELKTINVKNFQSFNQIRPEETAPYFILKANDRVMVSDGELVLIDKLYGEWNDEDETNKKSPSTDQSTRT